MTIGRLITPNIKLVREIGHGGMGTVWAAENLTLGSHVAVKLMARGYADNEAAIIRFKQEAQRAARVRSPHVATVFEHGMTPQGEPFIVMELLDGETLANRIGRHGCLTLADTEELIGQTARALAAAHKLGVVHRDIKPANLFIVDNAGEPFVMVVDFGIAKQMDVPPDLTTTNMWLGSPPYMSPEQYTNPKQVDFRTDLWSLGVVAYEALTGTRPFHSSSRYGLAFAISEGTFTLPTALKPELPESIDDWMLKALAKNPDNRFGSAKEMAAWLGSIVHSSGSQPPKPISWPPNPGGSGEFRQFVLDPPPAIPDKPVPPTEPSPNSMDKTDVESRPSSLPPLRMVRRGDMPTPPFPVERAPLVVARTFDPFMVTRIEHGFLPRDENDKWFAFTEGNHVFFHRSNTKEPVYEVILESMPYGRKRIAQAWVAANKKAMQNANLLVRLFDELFSDDAPAGPLSVRYETRQPGQRIWIYEGDLTTLTVDAIVNSADPSLLGGTGLDGDIHRAAGAGLLAECRALGGCQPGEAKMTKGHSLPAKYVVHTVGPVWRAGLMNERGRSKLAACYTNSLALAANAGLRTIAFPSISTGTKGFPLHDAAFIAATATLDFLSRRSSVELVIFCTFSAAHTEAANAGLARTLKR